MRKDFAGRLKSKRSETRKYERKTYGTLLCRVESYDSVLWKVTVRDMDGVLYWESKGVSRHEVLDLAGVALFAIGRLPKSKREDLIVPGSKPVAISDQDWQDFLTYIEKATGRGKKSAV
jgi:hypothetical protein